MEKKEYLKGYLVLPSHNPEDYPLETRVKTTEVDIAHFRAWLQYQDILMEKRGDRISGITKDVRKLEERQRETIIAVSVLMVIVVLTWLGVLMKLSG